MYASPRLLMLMFIVVSLAGCGPTTPAPTRTAATAGHGLIFVTDRTIRRLSVVDPATRASGASVALASSPAYVRYVEPGAPPPIPRTTETPRKPVCVLKRSIDMRIWVFS